MGKHISSKALSGRLSRGYGESAAEAYLSALTPGESVQGVVRAPEARRPRLFHWLARVQEAFAGWVLPLDAEVIGVWGRLIGEALAQGHPL